MAGVTTFSTRMLGLWRESEGIVIGSAQNGMEKIICSMTRVVTEPEGRVILAGWLMGRRSVYLPLVFRMFVMSTHSSVY